MFLKECNYIKKEKCLKPYIGDDLEFSSDEKASDEN